MLHVAPDLEPATRFAFYPHHLYSIHTDAFGTTPERELERILERRPPLAILGHRDSCVWISREAWEMTRASFEEAGYHTVRDVMGCSLMKPVERADGGRTP